MKPNEAKVVRAAMGRSAATRALLATYKRIAANSFDVISLLDGEGGAMIALAICDDESKTAVCIPLSRSVLKTMLRDFDAVEKAERIIGRQVYRGP